MKKALIFQGKLVEVHQTGFPVTPEMHWLDVADDVTVETHQYNGAEVVPNPPKPPAEVKAAAIRDINAQRDAKLAAGFMYNDHLYHADVVFQSQLQAFVLAFQTGLLPTDAKVAIRRKDNTTAQMTQAEVTALAGALMQFVQTAYAQSWTAKDAL